MFIPLFVIRRYRVRDAGSNRYQFYTKLALTRGQKAWNTAVAGCAIACICIVSVYGSPAKSAPYSPPSNPAVTAPRPETSSSRVSLAAELNRRRPVLEAEQTQLKAEESTINLEKSALTSLRHSIESRRALYPDGLPPAESAQDGVDVDLYNRRLAATRTRISRYDSRIESWKKSVSEFNGLVRQHNLAR